MAMSDDYYSKTRPNGMPEYAWKEMQAKKKAEEEEKKKAEEAAKKKAEEIKKAAEESAKKAVEDAVNNLLNGNYVAPGTVTVPQEMIDGYNKYQNEKAAEEIVNNLKAEEEAKKKAEAEAKKKAEEEEKKNNTSSSSTSKANGTSSNDARAEQMAIKNNTTPDYSKDYTGNVHNTANGDTHSSGSARIPSDSSTVSSVLGALLGDTVQSVVNKVVSTTNSTVDRVVDALADSFTSVLNPKPDNTGLTTEDARDEKIAIKNNTTPDYAVKDNGYVPNTGLTTDDARKEHINIMNDPTINPPTDGQISAGATIPQETIDQINQLIKDNSPSDVIYNPTDYVGGTYTPLFPQGGETTTNPTTPVTPLTLATTSKEVADYALAIMQAAKGDLGEVVKPEYMQATAPTTPELRTLEELAKTYGITYDYDSIYKVLNDSVEKQYDAIYERQKQNEATYYDNATAAQNTLLDTLSRDRSSAVQAGVSKGMQAANALGAMLGVSQQFAGNATALSQERGNTAKDYGAALAKAVVDAERTSNERKNAIMEISKMLYGYDSEQYVANMDNYNTILTNNTALQQAYMNNQTTLQNALASIFNNSAANKISGDANIQSNQLIADANIQASKNTAEANRLAAQYAAEAQRYAAYQAAEANKQAAAYAAQGNVNAYKEYANALVQQSLIGSGQSSLAGYEVPKADGTGTDTTTGTNTTAKKNPLAYTNAANAANNTAANIVANLALKLIGK